MQHPDLRGRSILVVENELLIAMDIVQALERAGVTPHELDLVIFSSTTPDYLIPASACLIQQKLGADRAGAFDVCVACSGFIYSLSVADRTRERRTRIRRALESRSYIERSMGFVLFCLGGWK